MVAVRAVYENGTLRLLEPMPIKLETGQVVILKTDPSDRNTFVLTLNGSEALSPEEEERILRNALGDSVRALDPSWDDGNAWVEDEAENIARELSQGEPLSEIVINERDED